MITLQQYRSGRRRYRRRARDATGDGAAGGARCERGCVHRRQEGHDPIAAQPRDCQVDRPVRRGERRRSPDRRAAPGRYGGARADDGRGEDASEADGRDGESGDRRREPEGEPPADTRDRDRLLQPLERRGTQLLREARRARGSRCTPRSPRDGRPGALARTRTVSRPARRTPTGGRAHNVPTLLSHYL